MRAFEADDSVDADEEDPFPGLQVIHREVPRCLLAARSMRRLPRRLL
ncbi:MAG: hypothetical protein HY943_04835 [Gammaproteobacteria bacterium]|nr:hypothetical protein [Gammaproteobacteria bacterium]